MTILVLVRHKASWIGAQELICSWLNTFYTARKYLVKSTVRERARKIVRMTSVMPLTKTMPGHLREGPVSHYDSQPEHDLQPCRASGT